jgi:hypothetical protein
VLKFGAHFAKQFDVTEFTADLIRFESSGNLVGSQWKYAHSILNAPPTPKDRIKEK